MEPLNYHHLRYFFAVAREGSVARASAQLGLKQPTVSAQVRLLEQRLGCKLLERSGRGLKVTPTGETVLRYAQSIFALGGELLLALDGQVQTTPELALGVSSTLPQAVVASLLDGVFRLTPKLRLTIVEGAMETLAAPLAAGSLQFALTDVRPAAGAAGVLHSRMLLQSKVEVFAPAALARKMQKNFPARLTGAPVLLPSGEGVRREVESWLARSKTHLQNLGEMPHPEIHAAAAGAVIFAPSVLRESLKKTYGLLPAGRLEGACWRVFAVTAGNIRHPALNAVTRSAKELR